MSRRTTKQRLDYKQIILDCQIRRLTDTETLEYFRINGINDISIATIKRYKTQIRQGAQTWISNLARSRRAEYIYEYKSRIDEIMKCQEELWRIYNDENTNPPVKVMALSKIMDATMRLTELYDVLPVIASIRHYDVFEQEEEHPVVRAVRDKDMSFSHTPTSSSSPCPTRLPLYDNDSNDKDKDFSSLIRDKSYAESRAINETNINRTASDQQDADSNDDNDDDSNDNKI